MTVNVTDVDTFSATVQAIADGDAATQANFLVATQQLANRTRYLKNVLESTGATLLRRGSTATMAALTGMANGSQFLATGFGLYTYDNASGATADGLLVFAASGGGRWLHELVTVANASLGFAVIGTAGGAAGRLPASIVPTRIVSAVGTTADGTTITSGAGVDVLTLTLTCAVGDIVFVDWDFYMNPGVRTISQSATIKDNGVDVVTLNGGVIETAGSHYVNYGQAYTVATGPTVIANLNLSTDTSTATFGKGSLKALVIRP